MSTAPAHLHLVGFPKLGWAAWEWVETCHVGPEGQPPAHLQAAISRGDATEPVRYIRADVAQQALDELRATHRAHLYQLLLSTALRHAIPSTPPADVATPSNEL